MKLWILVFAATSCVTPEGGAVQQAMCEQFGYIYYSGRDTDETVTQINKHNRVMEALCQKVIPKS